MARLPNASASSERFLSEDLPTQTMQDSSDLSTGGPKSEAPEDDEARAAPAPEAPPLTGTLLAGRFQLVECVARGPLGEIYRARDRLRAAAGAADVDVAVKILDAGLRRPREQLRQLQQSVLRMQSLGHAHIVRVFSLEQDLDVSFCVMEWLDGESLATLLNRLHPVPVEPALVRDVAAGVGAALTYAHDCGLVHGDIKPANVFVGGDGGIKLLDFNFGNTTDATGPVLTPEYASCEQLEGQAAQPEDDIFAFACLLYRMIAGMRPFGAQTALEAERDDIRPVPPAGLDEEQWKVMRSALAFRRENRSARLHSLINAVSRPPAEPATDTGRRRRINPWLATVPTGLLAGLLLLGLSPSAREALVAGWQALVGEGPSAERPVSVSLPDAPARRQTPEKPSSQARVTAGDDDDGTDWMPQPVAPSDGRPGQSALPTPQTPADQAEPESDSVDPAENIPTGSAAAEPEPGASGKGSPESRPSTASTEAEPLTAAVEPGNAIDEATAQESPPAAGPLGFANTRYTVRESDGFMRLLVQAPADHSGIELELSIAGGTATADEDFVSLQRRLELAPGETRLTVLLPLIDDGQAEYVEEVLLRLEPRDATYPLVWPEALVVIIDDDGG